MIAYEKTHFLASWFIKKYTFCLNFSHHGKLLKAGSVSYVNNYGMIAKQAAN